MSYPNSHRDDLVIKTRQEQLEQELKETIDSGWNDPDAFSGERGITESLRGTYSAFNQNYEGMSEAERKQWATKCRKMYDQDSNFRNMINTTVAVVMGSGMRVFVKSSDNAQRNWDIFWRKNKFQKKQFQIFRTMLIEGEAFVRLFRKPFSRKGIEARLIPPSKVSNIVTDEKDFEVVKYYEISTGKMGKTIKVRADDMIHFKLDPYGTRIRGLPLISKGAVAKMQRYDTLEHVRLLLNLIRASIPLVHEIEGTKEQIEKAAAKHNKMPKPGSKATLSSREKLYYPDLKIGADDVSADADRMREGMASDVSLTTDFTSGRTDMRKGQRLLESGSPVVKYLEMVQTYFLSDWEDLIDVVIGDKADRDAKLPRIPQRNLQSDAQGLREFHKIGAISISDVATYMDLDWDNDVLPNIQRESEALRKLGLVQSGEGLVLSLGPDDPRISNTNEPPTSDEPEPVEESLFEGYYDEDDDLEELDD